MLAPPRESSRFHRSCTCCEPLSLDPLESAFLLWISTHTRIMQIPLTLYLSGPVHLLRDLLQTFARLLNSQSFAQQIERKTFHIECARRLADRRDFTDRILASVQLGIHECPFPF